MVFITYQMSLTNVYFHVRIKDKAMPNAVVNQYQSKIEVISSRGGQFLSVDDIKELVTHTFNEGER